MQRRILLVDDNADLVDSLAVGLAMASHIVRTAADAESALQETAEFHPDVMIVDLGLPGMSGLELVELVRSRPQTAPIKIIVLSGHSDETHRLQALEAGCDAYLVKPADFSELCSEID